MLNCNHIVCICISQSWSEKVYRGNLEDGGKGCDFLINFKKWGKTISIKTLDPLMTHGKKRSHILKQTCS